MFENTWPARLKAALNGGTRLDLFYILERSQDELTLEEAMDWLEQLAFWIRTGPGSAGPAEARIRLLLQRLEQTPLWKEASGRQIRRLFLQASAVRLFTEAGIPSSSVFLREAATRLFRSILPPEANPHSYASILARAFPNQRSHEWLEDLPTALRDELVTWIFPEPADRSAFKQALTRDAHVAITILALRSAEIALREDVEQRAARSLSAENPFLGLLASVNRVYALPAEEHHEIQPQIDSCRLYLKEVQTHLEQAGVSVDLVFQLERANAYLDRLEAMITLVHQPSHSEVWNLVTELAQGVSRHHGLGRLIRSNLHLISRKTVERTGEVGEDYITRNTEEYRSMFLYAAGGGALTAVTALLKLLTPVGMPPFFEALYATLNYSTSFLLMHVLHFKLATKQPSMTAAALAGKISRTQGEFVDEVARISRSQFAAVAGNLLAVIPAALVLDALVQALQGGHLLTDDKALQVLNSVNPLTTFTILFATLTGGMLWLSGFVAGWIENGYVYHRLPFALKNQRFLRNLLGAVRLERLIQQVGKNIMGVSSALLLGLFLAFIPVIGDFFGLPLDVRHITLSTGSLTYAFAGLGLGAITWQMATTAAVGIICIGLLNFGISFALALAVAIRAKSIEGANTRQLMGWIFREALIAPRKFFLPEKTQSSDPLASRGT